MNALTQKKYVKCVSDRSMLHIGHLYGHMYKMFGKWNKVLCCVVLVISADCETGNKWSFEMIISDQEAGRLPPGVICSVMPDPVYGGKLC